VSSYGFKTEIFSTRRSFPGLRRDVRFQMALALSSGRQAGIGIRGGNAQLDLGS
jgi:hypothetical protein